MSVFLEQAGKWQKSSSLASQQSSRWSHTRVNGIRCSWCLHVKNGIAGENVSEQAMLENISTAEQFVDTSQTRKLCVVWLLTHVIFSVESWGLGSVISLSLVFLAALPNFVLQTKVAFMPLSQEMPESAWFNPSFFMLQYCSCLDSVMLMLNRTAKTSSNPIHVDWYL